MVKKFINDYLYKHFNITIPEINIISKKNIFFAEISFKSENIVIPLIFNILDNFYLLDEFFIDKNIEEKFISLNDEIYKQFDYAHKILFFVRLYALKINYTGFYLVSENSIYLKVPRGLFSGSQVKNKYSEFFNLLLVGEFSKLENSLFNKDSLLHKHLLYLSKM